MLVLALKTLTFHYKNDATNTPEFGLVAERSSKDESCLVGMDKEGKPYCVRYEQINAMLLNEFLTEHRKVQAQARKMDAQEHKIGEQEVTIAELKSSVAQLRSGMDVLTARLEEQAPQSQKVSTQLEVSKSSTQMVLKNQ